MAQSDYVRRLREKRKQAKSAVAPKVDFFDKLPDGTKVQCEITSAKMNEEMKIRFGLKVIRGEYAGKKPYPIGHDLLWEPKEEFTKDGERAYNGLDFTRGTFERLGLDWDRISDLEPKIIKDEIAKAVGMVCDITIKDTKDDRYQRTYINGLVNAPESENGEAEDEGEHEEMADRRADNAEAEEEEAEEEVEEKPVAPAKKAPSKAKKEEPKTLTEDDDWGAEFDDA